MPARRPLPPVFVDGRLFRPTVHHFVPTHPRRWVVSSDCRVGWNACDRCGREHRIWMTDDATWRRLPRAWWRKRICTRCFRVLVRGGGRD